MPTAMKKVVNISERVFADHETGEVRSEERTTVTRLPQEPAYVKLYIEDLGRILDLPTGPRDILYSLLRKLDYDGLISLTSGGRKRIAEAHGIKEQSVSNYLTMLVKKEVLKIVARGEYELNPHLFAKGDWDSIYRRRGNFKMTVTYTEDGQRVVTGKAEPHQQELFQAAGD